MFVCFVLFSLVTEASLAKGSLVLATWWGIFLDFDQLSTNTKLHSTYKLPSTDSEYDNDIGIITMSIFFEIQPIGRFAGQSAAIKRPKVCSPRI